MYGVILGPKHRLWVLVRTAPARRFSRVPTMFVLSINIKNIFLYLMNPITLYRDFSSILIDEKSLYIAWANFRNGNANPDKMRERKQSTNHHKMCYKTHEKQDD